MYTFTKLSHVQFQSSTLYSMRAVIVHGQRSAPFRRSACSAFCVEPFSSFISELNALKFGPDESPTHARIRALIIEWKTLKGGYTHAEAGIEGSRLSLSVRRPAASVQAQTALPPYCSSRHRQRGRGRHIRARGSRVCSEERRRGSG